MILGLRNYNLESRLYNYNRKFRPYNCYVTIIFELLFILDVSLKHIVIFNDINVTLFVT